MFEMDTYLGVEVKSSEALLVDRKRVNDYLRGCGIVT
jgi:hypothetical protein